MAQAATCFCCGVDRRNIKELSAEQPGFSLEPPAPLSEKIESTHTSVVVELREEVDARWASALAPSACEDEGSETLVVRAVPLPPRIMPPPGANRSSPARDGNGHSTTKTCDGALSAPLKYAFDLPEGEVACEEPKPKQIESPRDVDVRVSDDASTYVLEPASAGREAGVGADGFYCDPEPSVKNELSPYNSIEPAKEPSSFENEDSFKGPPPDTSREFRKAAVVFVFAFLVISGALVGMFVARSLSGY